MITEEAPSAAKEMRHIVRTIASAAASWVFLSAVLSLALTIVAIEWTALGPLFIPRIFSAWALASLAGALLTFLLERQKAKQPTPSKGKPLTRVNANLILSIFANLKLTQSPLMVVSPS